MSHTRDMVEMCIKRAFMESQATARPAFIQELIDLGKLYPDGRRVNRSLGDVIAFLRNEKCMEPTVRYIQENFWKPDGMPYAEKTIRHEMEMAKAEKK